ncbi:phage distal tail protein [Paenibacillus sp. UASWS1643]|uniref:phage distal tail protein n=1 Tax=Paenibacillus sp. UASWS1643 TaxID=2580422 RepID=UPI001CC2EB51|nr:phage tail domain-containing protein [Paenibacillus sp. UASWS1643]
MFNRAPFNRSPFNRTLSFEALFTVAIESATDLSARISVDFPVMVTFESATDLTAEFIREMAMTAEITTATEMLAQLVRERLFGASITTATDFVVTVTHAHINEIGLTGTFRPGDVIVIDTARQTITINGENALHLMTGDFFDLVYGANKLTYSDSETARNVRTRVTHRDKFLY